MLAQSSIHSPQPSATTSNVTTTDYIPYMYTGVLSVGNSPVIRPHLNIQFAGFSGSIGQIGSGNVTVGLFVNGEIQATLEFTTSGQYQYVTFDPISLNARVDTYYIVVLASAGASDLAGEIEVCV